MKYFQVRVSDNELIGVGDLETAQHLQKNDPLKRNLIPIGYGVYIVSTLNRGEVLELSGLNTPDIDPAIPNQVLHMYKQEHGVRPDGFFNYNDNKFGELLLMNEVLHMVAERIRSAMAQGFYVEFNGVKRQEVVDVMDWVKVEGGSDGR